MSYCFKGPDCDVDMVTISTGIICCNCDIYGGEPHFNTERGALDHLRAHIKCGDKIPQHAINRLNREIFNLVQV